MYALLILCSATCVSKRLVVATLIRKRKSSFCKVGHDSLLVCDTLVHVHDIV